MDFFNGPNVTRPVCKTLTQTVTASLKRMDFYMSLFWPLLNVVIQLQFLIHTSCGSDQALCLGLLDNVSITTHHFKLQKLIKLLWLKYIRQFLNGPNVTHPDCEILTQTA